MESRWWKRKNLHADDEEKEAEFPWFPHLFMLGNFTTLLLQGKKFSIVNPHVCGEIFWRSVGEKKVLVHEGKVLR